jgi:mediator of RNA polymerase II transcription subunit 10
LLIHVVCNSFIDEGRNPDEYTRNLLNSCVQCNQVSRGKVDAFKALRKHLLEEAEDAFPDEIEAYRAMRNQSSLEARRALQSSDLLSNGNLKVKSEHWYDLTVYLQVLVGFVPIP